MNDIPEVTFDTHVLGGGYTSTTPREMVRLLRSTHRTDEDLLDWVKTFGDTLGWTRHLRLVGLLLLKPDAPEGQEAEA
jgi:hypothetical protein